jgi:hypothetical protein
MTPALTLAPRLLTLGQAAEYCGLSENKFRGLYDGPEVHVEGRAGNVRMRRYDRLDLDQWIERLKGQGADALGADAKKWIERAGFKSKDGQAA